MVRVPKGRVNCCLFSFSCPSFWVINKKCIMSYNLQDIRSSNCCTKHISSYVWHNNITWLITVIWLHICLEYMTPEVLEALFRVSRFLSPSEGDIASAYFICTYSHSRWGLLNFKRLQHLLPHNSFIKQPICSLSDPSGCLHTFR